MKKVTTFLLGCVAFGALNCSANAADMSVKARPMMAEIYNWTGFYVGAHFGVGYDGDRDSATAQRFTGGGVNPQPLQSGRFREDLMGFGGGQIGYNWQAGTMVLGMEADISGVAAANRSLFLAEGPFTYTANERAPKWFGTVRGRAGYLFTPRTLGYITGGLAFGETQPVNQIVTGPGPVGTFAFSNGPTGVHAGWTIGGGVEYMVDAKWSVKGEYQYIDLGNEIGGTNRIVFNAGQAGVFTTQGNFRTHTLQIGANYHFGG